MVRAGSRRLQGYGRSVIEHRLAPLVDPSGLGDRNPFALGALLSQRPLELTDGAKQPEHRHRHWVAGVLGEGETFLRECR